MLLLCLLVAALGAALYHVAQKTLSAETNPMVLLMAVYAVAFVLAGAAAPFFPASGSLARVVSWPVFFLGLSVLMIEIGFLLAYRAGGQVQWSGVAVNGFAAVLLAPVAVWMFRETLSPQRIAGLLLTLAGLALLARK